MKISFFFLLFYGVLSSLNAQHLGYNQSELISREGGKVSAANLDNQYADIKGSAFFSAQWLPADAITDNGTRYPGLKVMFDVYRNTFFANIKDTLYDLGATRISRFVLYPSAADTAVSYIFQKGFSTAGIRPEQYVQVLASGKLRFLKQMTLEVREVNEDSFLAKVKKFIGQDYYYLLTADGQGGLVRLNKKILEKEMADKWDQVNRYAREKDISFSEEEGWVSLVKFYNSIN